MARLNDRPLWIWLIIACIAVVGIGSLMTRNAWWGIGACLAFIALVIGVRVYEKRIRARQAAVDEELFLEYTQKIALGESIKVRARTGIVLFAVVVAIAIAMTLVLPFNPPWEAWMVTCVAWLIALPLGAFSVLKIGRPALEISSAGVTSPSGCLITWAEIDGLYLDSVKSKGSTIGHRLFFAVPRLRERIDDMRPLARMLFKLTSRTAASERMIVSLFSPSESAQLVHKLCDAVWKRTTKRTNYWNPHMSRKQIASMKRLEKLSEQIDVELRDGAPTLATAQMLRVEGEAVLAEINKLSRQGTVPPWIAVLVVGVVLGLILLVALGK